jgi:PAS domain S-box-containing protein
MSNTSNPLPPHGVGSDKSDFRRRAEQQASLSPEAHTHVPLEDTRLMIYELRVHQIQLEMQNEELRQTQAELNATRARYFDLYDLAPAGYLTLGKNGLIQEANLWASTLLGMLRGKLVGQPISKFLRKGDQDGYYLFHKQLFATGEPQTCELRMVKRDDSPFWGQLSATVARNADNEPVCRIVLIDITERKQMEEELLMGRIKLDLALQSAQMGAWQLNSTENKRVFDNQVCRTLGIDPATFGGTAEEFLGAVHPADREYIKDNLKETIEQNRPYMVEYRVVWPDGSIHHIAARGNLVHDAKGSQEIISGIIWDITERKQAEERLREHEENYRTLADSGMALIWTSGTDKKCDYFNQIWLRFTGRTLEQEFGDGWTDGVHPDDLARCFKIYTEAFDRREPFSMDYRLRRHDGEFRWILDEGSPRHDSRGNFLGYIGHCLDITERKEVSEALRESEERFTRLAEQTGTFFWDVDAQGLFTYASPVVEKVLGYRLDEMIGRMHFFDFHPESGREAFKAEAFAIFQRKDAFTDFVNVVQTKDGRAVWLSTTGQPILNVDGSLRGYRGSDIDITERKRLQEELMKLDKLQSIGTLAGGIAHDFNNILQGLYGNISLAKEELAGTHPSYELLEEAGKSMTRAVRLTKQLLTFAKGGDPVKARVSLGATVEDVARFDLVGSNVSLVYQPAETLWPIDADEGQIQQVVSNLVINARQAMPKGGHLYVTLENADLAAEAVRSLKQGRYIRLILRDEGCGIEPTLIENIFDPYFTTKQTGSGLGLTTVWAIIAKHNGQIGVVSEVGKGTTFTIYLPASASLLPAETQTPAEECPAMARPAKILALEDEDSVIKILVRMLTSCGYTVVTTPDGQEAVTLYRQAMEAGAPFDAVILDLTIPGGPGGEEVIKDLLALDPNVRAIVSSGYANNPVMSDPAAYGFKGTISKPYTVNALRKIVASLIGCDSTLLNQHPREERGSRREEL